MTRNPSAAESAGAASSAVRLVGADVLPLLHRISTNALLDLGAGQARATLFCDFRGRLLHRAIVHHARDGAVWLLRDDAPGAMLAAFIDRHVFRDQVAIEDRSGALPVSPAFGDQEGKGEVDGVPRHVSVGEEALRVGEPHVARDLLARIESGHPAHGHEIVEEFTPFEVGLGDEVHLDKGCFTGQEALQRLVTYHSVRRRLARIEGDGVPPPSPADLTLEGERVGRVTSAASRKDAAGWLGLAVVKIETLEAGGIPSAGGARLSRPPEPLRAPRPLGRP